MADLSNLLVFILLPLSLAVWIILSFCQKRTKCALGVCYDRPGVVYPINFLTPRHRLVYSLVCAAQGSLWLNIIVMTFNFDVEGSKWLKAFVSAIVLIIAVLILVMVTYPMLACVEAPIPIVGYVLGFTYSFIYFVVYLTVFGMLLKEPSAFEKSIHVVSVVFQMMPQLICVFVVIIWYGYKLLKECRRLVGVSDWRTAIFQQPPSLNNSNYVRALLKHSNRSPDLVTLYDKINLPLPVLIATAISIVVMIQLTVIFCVILLPFIDIIFGSNDADSYKILKSLKTALTVLVVVPSFFANGMIIVLFGHLLMTIRKEILLIRRGQSELCQYIHRVSLPSLKLTSYVRFAGTQVAALITGWIFYYLLFAIVLGFFGLVYYLPDIFGYILYLMVAMASLSFGIWLVEVLMCHFLFLTSESTFASTISLDNRRIFNYFTFTLLLYNIATGLYTNLIRVLTGIVLSFLVMPRLDRVLYVKPFQSFDGGYSTYRNFMITEGIMNNPVVHVFVDLLVNSSERRRTSDKPYHYTQEKQDYRFSLKAKNRWLKAITLLNNPQLRRKSQQLPSHHCGNGGSGNAPKVDDDFKVTLIGGSSEYEELQ